MNTVLSLRQMAEIAAPIKNPESVRAIRLCLSGEPFITSQKEGSRGL